MAITLAAAAGLFGGLVLFEGLAALLEHIEGDPEADVALALQQLASQNQRRAFSIAATEQAGREDVNQKFASANQIPSRVLSQEALLQQGDPFTTPDSELLDFVSSRLRVSPSDLSRMSSPTRAGDLSQLHRQLGQSLPSVPLAPNQQPGQPQQ